MFMMIDSLEAKPKLSVATHHQPTLSLDAMSKKFYLLAERSLILRKWFILNKLPGKSYYHFPEFRIFSNR